MEWPSRKAGSRFRVALVYLFLAAVVGLLLRYKAAFGLPIDFQFFLHAHSHTAMLGWLYLAVFTLFNDEFLNEGESPGKYDVLFWGTWISVLGMLCSFPFQGYGSVSIPFSTLHIILSYFYIYHFWKDTAGQNGKGVKMARISLLFMLLSTVGIWVLAPIMANDMKDTIWYEMAIQFFLHFQFNGWFLFAALAIFFDTIEKNGPSIPHRLFSWLFPTLILSSLFTYTLTVSWAIPYFPVFLLNGLGVTLQLIAMVVLLAIIIRVGGAYMDRISPGVKALPWVALSALFLKVVFQSLGILPGVVLTVFTIRDLVVGFIHLLLVGVVTSVLFGDATHRSLLSLKGAGRAGLWLFYLAFIGVEVMLFIQGGMNWMMMGTISHYDLLLFILSIPMPLGVLLILIAGRNEKGMDPR